VAAGFVACTTESGNRKRLMQHMVPPQPLLAGEATFAGGAVSVQAWLGPSVRRKKTAGEPGGEHDVAAEGRRGHRPGGGDNDQLSGTPFEERGNQYSQEELDEMYGRSNFSYLLPPRIALMIKLVDAGARPIAVTITEVSSALGNFAARPEKVTLVPGEQVSLDPMLSNLDTNFDELPLTVTLKVGPKNETQQLTLRRTPETPPPAPPK
jgi:hypothetical protein